MTGHTQFGMALAAPLTVAASIGMILLGCSIEPVDFDGRKCPCAPGYICEDDVCISPLGGGRPDSGVRPQDGGSDAGVPDGSRGDAARPEESGMPDPFEVHDVPGLLAAVALAKTMSDPPPIRMANATYVLSSELVLDSRITLQGSSVCGAVLDGVNATRLVHVTESGRATLRSLTIQRGSASGRAGGMLIQGGTASLIDSCVRDNAATGAAAEGGGIAVVSNGSLNLQNVKVTGNRAVAYGGGISVRSATSFAMTGSEVSNNTLSGHTETALGLGVYVATCPDVSFESSLFAENTSTEPTFGGALAFSGRSSTSMQNVTISGNSCRNAAAIYTWNAALRVRSTTIANNVVTGDRVWAHAVETPDLSTVTFRDTIFSGNRHSAGGNRDCDDNDQNTTSLGGNIGFAQADDPTFAARFDCGLTAPGDRREEALVGNLGDNGGPTRTHALPSGSSALGFGTDCPPFDQRGAPRTRPCDSGAYEAP